MPDVHGLYTIASHCEPPVATAPAACPRSRIACRACPSPVSRHDARCLSHRVACHASSPSGRPACRLPVVDASPSASRACRWQHAYRPSPTMRAGRLVAGMPCACRLRDVARRERHACPLVAPTDCVWRIAIRGRIGVSYPKAKDFGASYRTVQVRARRYRFSRPMAPSCRKSHRWQEPSLARAIAVRP